MTEDEAFQWATENGVTIGIEKHHNQFLLVFRKDDIYCAVTRIALKDPFVCAIFVPAISLIAKEAQ